MIKLNPSFHFFPIIIQMNIQFFKLQLDPRQISSITSMRVMVANALLFTYTSYYLFIAIAANVFKQDIKAEAIQDLGRRLTLYGIAALISISFLNYGIFHAIMAWACFITVLITQGMFLMIGVSERSKFVAISSYYTLIGIWFIGIILFYILNAINPEATSS